MLSSPRLPASWVGFNAGASTPLSHVSSGVLICEKYGVLHAKPCTVMHGLIESRDFVADFKRGFAGSVLPVDAHKHRSVPRYISGDYLLLKPHQARIRWTLKCCYF